MRTLFWFSVGVGVAFLVITKGKDLVQQFTPAGVAQQIQTKSANVAERASAFWSIAKDAAQEREAELREHLGMYQS